MKENIWQKDTKFIDPKSKFLLWLKKPKKLSPKMKELCNKLELHVISQEINSILNNEKVFINTSKNLAFVRKVYITGDNTPWEYARVIVPEETYNKYKDKFIGLNNKFIGESLLYNNNTTIRSEFEFTKISPNDYLFKEISSAIPELKAKEIYGRRSIFYLDKKYPILVCEFFLPDIPIYIDNHDNMNMTKLKV